MHRIWHALFLYCFEILRIWKHISTIFTSIMRLFFKCFSCMKLMSENYTLLFVFIEDTLLFSLRSFSDHILWKNLQWICFLNLKFFMFVLQNALTRNNNIYIYFGNFTWFIVFVISSIVFWQYLIWKSN